jgi:hypothetical protein
MEKSESIKNIATALVKFQTLVGKIKKDSNNPFFKSKYADLSGILDSIHQPLIDCNLTVNQFPSGKHELTTILIHAESGEFIMSTYEMTPVKNDPQGLGSCITYQRRYALGAALSLNIDEDDDGNSASGNGGKSDKSEKAWLNPGTPQWSDAIVYLKGDGTLDKIKGKYNLSKKNEEQLKSDIL